jgi:Zinc knuckle
VQPYRGRSGPKTGGYSKLEGIARLKVVIDPNHPLFNKIPLLLPGGERFVVLIHYERLQRVCLYCAKIGHEIEGCEDRNNLLAYLKTYPEELHAVLRDKRQPRVQKWIKKTT